MIAICSPTRESFHSRFTSDLVQLVQKEGLEVLFLVSEGTLLCNQRTDLVRAALISECTHILFIDSDMSFPVNTLERLLAHDKDIIGANCIQRGTGYPTAATPEGILLSSKNMKGIDKIGSLGFGVMLIKAEVFRKTPFPWFATPYEGTIEDGKFIGEDRFFCYKATEAGFEIWMDHDLSQEIGHIGTYQYRIETCLNQESHE